MKKRFVAPELRPEPRLSQLTLLATVSDTLPPE